MVLLPVLCIPVYLLLWLEEYWFNFVCWYFLYFASFDFKSLTKNRAKLCSPSLFVNTHFVDRVYHFLLNLFQIASSSQALPAFKRSFIWLPHSVLSTLAVVFRADCCLNLHFLNQKEKRRKDSMRVPTDNTMWTTINQRHTVYMS